MSPVIWHDQITARLRKIGRHLWPFTAITKPIRPGILMCGQDYEGGLYGLAIDGQPRLRHT